MKTSLQMPSQSGKTHVTNSPQIHSSRKDGISQPFFQSTRTNASPDTKISSQPPRSSSPTSNQLSGQNKSSRPTKCIAPGKPSITTSPPKNASPFQSAYGTTSTTTSTCATKPIPGNYSSTITPLVDGVEITKSPQQQQDYLLNTLYYDGETQPFFPPPSSPTRTPIKSPPEQQYSIDSPYFNGDTQLSTNPIPSPTNCPMPMIPPKTPSPSPAAPPMPLPTIAKKIPNTSQSTPLTSPTDTENNLPKKKLKDYKRIKMTKIIIKKAKKERKKKKGIITKQNHRPHRPH
jgi:hypothetical protein